MLDTITDAIESGIIKPWSLLEYVEKSRSNEVFVGEVDLIDYLTLRKYFAVDLCQHKLEDIKHLLGIETHISFIKKIAKTIEKTKGNQNLTESELYNQLFQKISKEFVNCVNDGYINPGIFSDWDSKSIDVFVGHIDLKAHLLDMNLEDKTAEVSNLIRQKLLSSDWVSYNKEDAAMRLRERPKLGKDKVKNVESISLKEYLKYFDIEKHGEHIKHPEVQTEMNKYIEEMRALKPHWCMNCGECHGNRLPTILKSKFCERCHKDYNDDREKHGKLNDMIPSKTPPELKDLTWIEELLIARVLPQVNVVRLKYGQRGWKGHVINYEQDTQTLVMVLPRLPENLSTILVTKPISEKAKKDGRIPKEYEVRKDKIRAALQYLIKNNPGYKDVKFSEDNLNDIDTDENGMIQGLPEISAEKFENEGVDFSNYDQGPCGENEIDAGISHSFVVEQCDDGDEITKLEKVIKGKNWVPQGGVVAENTPYLASMCFPTLFPDGKGDPTAQNRKFELTWNQYLRHLIWYAEKNESWSFDWKFQKHSSFMFWAFNRKIRTKLRDSSWVYSQLHPEMSNLTPRQIQHIFSHDRSKAKRMRNYMNAVTTDVQGSDGYFKKAANDLKAIIREKGPATCFLTLSAPDKWETMFYEYVTGEKGYPGQKKAGEILRDHPLLAVWWFRQRVDCFLKHFFKTMNVKYHWERVVSEPWIESPPFFSVVERRAKHSEIDEKGEKRSYVEIKHGRS